MAVLRVFRAGLPIAEVDVPAGGLSIGTAPGDDVRLGLLGVAARDEDGGRLSPRGDAWTFAPRRGGPEVALEPGAAFPVGDAVVEIAGAPAARVLDLASLASGPSAPETPLPPRDGSAAPLQALADAVEAVDVEAPAGALSSAVSRALSLAGARRGFAGVLEADGRGLRVLGSVGLDGDDPRRQVSRSVVETVLREGREVVTGDARRDIPTQSVALMGLRIVCASPIRARGRVAGVVYADAGPGTSASPGAVLAYLRVLAGLLSRRLADEERRREEAEQGRGAVARARDAVADDEVVWASPAMRRLRDEAERVAKALESRSLPVLLTGETGSGKEVLARWLHERAEGGRPRFVAVNCAAIPRDLAESELFGIEQGVATGVLRRLGRFQQADGGTLFLDEVGEMDAAVQGKVLRTVETRRIQRVGGRDEVPVDVRIVSATNRPLGEAIRAGRFREDLYWRLCGVELRVPPLRERPEDVPVLAAVFLRRFAREYGSPVASFSPAATARLLAHAWPGNVRELRQRVGSLVVLARGPTIEADDVERNLGGGAPGAGDGAPARDPVLRTIDEVDREHVERVLARVGGDRARAAEILGIHRKTLGRWLRDAGDEGGDREAAIPGP